MTEQFSTFDVARILGIKRERLRQWHTLGYIPKGTKRPRGSSHKYTWCRHSLHKINIFCHLVDFGLKRKPAQEVILNKKLFQGDFFVVCNGRCRLYINTRRIREATNRRIKDDNQDRRDNQLPVAQKDTDQTRS